MNMFNEIKNLDEKIDYILKTSFNSFEDAEIEMFKAIEHYETIIAYIKSHTEICDETTWNIINNGDENTEAMDKNFKPLTKIFILKNDLFSQYNKLIEEFINNKNFEKAIEIYEKLYKLTKDLDFKKIITEIYFNEFNGIEKGLEYYKQCENEFADCARFYWIFSELYKNLGDYYSQVYCIQKAVEIEKRNFASLSEGNL